jgi:hypothetical protein
MIKSRMLCLLLALCSSAVFAQQSVEINFQYTGDHRVDLSKMRGPMKIPAFTDTRDGGNPLLITSESLGNDAAAGGYQAERAVADIIHDAMVQGFEKGGAKLVESGETTSLVGSLVASEAQLVDRGGVPSIQITLRTNIKLQGGGRTIWETTLFGRGIAPVSDGVVAAVHAALDRSIRELVQDDYFLLEIN